MAQSSLFTAFLFTLCMLAGAGLTARWLQRSRAVAPGSPPAVVLSVPESLMQVAYSTSDGIVITGLDGRITWVNAAFEHISGYRLDELLGQHPGRLLQCDETDPQTVQRMRDALRLRQPLVCELVNQGKSGRRYWIEVRLQPLHDAKRRVAGFLALQTDITARRTLKAELRQNIELLRGAIDTIDEAFVLYDPDDRLVYCNEKYLDLYATSRDVIVPGARFEDIIRTGALRGQYPAANGQVEEWVAHRLAMHRAGNRTLVQQLDNGRFVRIVERRMASGHLVGFRVDITDLMRATEAAEQADRAKSEFIATISHELRTPLQSITGFSDLGRHFARGQVPYEQMFEDIHQGGQRMLRLVNGLLDVSKIDGTQGSMALKRCDIALLAAEVVHELTPLATEKRLQVVQPSPRPVLMADVEAFRFQQVIRNVLANAIRFAPPGSRIDIEAGDHGPAGLWLSVRDHGPGIPANELDSVFEPFVQSSRTRNGSGGTGLGLAISRKIMRAHGGHIEAQCPEDGGTRIQLSLPAAAPTGEARVSRSLRAVRQAIEQAQEDRSVPRPSPTATEA